MWAVAPSVRDLPPLSLPNRRILLRSRPTSCFPAEVLYKRNVTLTLGPLPCDSPGKSSLAVRYVDGHFVESYYPTIENTFSKEIRHRNQDFSTEIVDTAGQVRSITQRNGPGPRSSAAARDTR